MIVFKGKTAKLYLRGVRGIHGPVRATYKVMWPEMRNQYLRSLQALDQDEQDIQIAKTMSRLLVDWNVTFPEDYPEVELRGKVVPFDAELLRTCCFPSTYNRMVNIITGLAEGDIDPEESMEQQAEQLKNKSKSSDELFRMLAEQDAEQVGNLPADAD